MRKFLLAAATVALLFATSCKEDTNAPSCDDDTTAPYNVQLGENEFLAIIDNGAVPQNAPAVRDGMNTMTIIDGERRVFWEMGDKIQINGAPYITETTGNSVIFTGEGAGTAPYHAFYPDDIAGTGNTGILPAEQRFTASDDVSNLPMYACSETKQLTFHNICAAIRITVPRLGTDIARIVISSDQQMNGSFTVDDSFKAVMTAPDYGLQEYNMKVTMIPDFRQFEENDVVYIAVPAQEYTNLRVEFFNDDNSVWRYTLDSCELEVNKIHDITKSEIHKELCFEAASPNCMITFNNIYALGIHGEIQYSLDGCTTWHSYDGPVVLANVGDRVYFRASRNHTAAFGGSGGRKQAYFSFTGNVKASGDIMSLYGPDCPDDMQLPVNAFGAMFRNCSTLMTAPELPAQNLAVECYFCMFEGCSSLTSAPELPARTLTGSCYFWMFEGCNNLKKVYIYATDVTAPACLDGWLSSAGTSAANPTVHCKSGMATTIERTVDTEVWNVIDDL